MANGEFGRIFGIPLLKRVPITKTINLSHSTLEEMTRIGATPTGPAKPDLTREYKTGERTVLTAQGWVAVGGLAIGIGGLATVLMVK